MHQGLTDPLIRKIMLTSHEIKKQMDIGNIKIGPWNGKTNPNSINLRLSKIIGWYEYASPSHASFIPKDRILDLKKENKIELIEITEENGFVLYPGTLYLGSTYEYTETHNLIPMIEGRSSVGRLGIQIHQTAGFGDINFCGHWTLEITVVHPIRIYPMVEICQIAYIVPDGEIDQTYKGKYQNQSGPVGSRMWKELVN